MDALPPYAARLSALHRALDNDFRGIVRQVPTALGQSVLDIGCGSGYFSALLADSGAIVTGLDSLSAYIELARARHGGGDRRLKFLQGDARRLPFADRSFDAVWSGHSMQSYPDLDGCLAETHRVLKPGGTLAVLETDNVHSVMLSWPPDLELAVRQAEHREIGDADSYRGTYFPRFAERMFHGAGLIDYEPRYVFIHRRGPAEAPLAEFVQLYLENLLEKTREHLGERLRAQLAALADPESESFLPRRSDFFFGSLQMLMLAKAPGGQ